MKAQSLDDVLLRLQKNKPKGKTIGGIDLTNLHGIGEASKRGDRIRFAYTDSMMVYDIDFMKDNFVLVFGNTIAHFYKFACNGDRKHFEEMMKDLLDDIDNPLKV